MSDVEAAAFPETFFTAYTNLFIEGRLAPTESVLIHAGASGVGTAAIQLAHAFGATVYATVGTDGKAEVCRHLGASVAVNYRQEDFAEVLRALPSFRGIDLVFDMVGRDYLERNLSLLNPLGRVVFVSLLSGSKVELDLRQVMAKRLRLVGTTLRIRSLDEKAQIRDGIMARFGEALRTGNLQPVLDRTFPIDQANAAHAVMERNLNIGKLVLEVS